MGARGGEIANDDYARSQCFSDHASLLIMICSRLDKIEIVTDKLRDTSEATKDVAIRTAERVNSMAPRITQAIEVLEKLRKDMGVFTKALVRYVQQVFRGDDQAGIEGSSDFEADV